MGNKANHLKKISELGFKVPNLITLSGSEIENSNFFKKLEQLAENKTYAVRSNMLIEDTKTSSFAGQFLTELNINKSDLEESIKRVKKQAESKKVPLSSISVIIQEFVEPDLAGVFFSRSPEGLRHFVCQYHEGRGEELVSGEVTGTTIKGYYPSQGPSWLNELSTIAQKLETEFGHAQDIEWCVQNNQLYILQSRAITSISPKQFQEIKELTKHLPQEKSYYYKKNEVADTVARPTPLMFDILKSIYGANGPIQQAYKKLSINYKTNPDLLKLIGNQLYVEQEVSRQSLFPKSFVTSFINKLRLHFYRVPSSLEQFFKLEQLFKNSPAVTDYNSWWQDFSGTYKEIFLSNLYTQKSLQKAQILTKNLKWQLPEILTLFPANTKIREFIAKLDVSDLSGNSLDLNDNSQTQKEFGSADKEITADLKAWWDSQNNFKKTYWQNIFQPVSDYMLLRELTRLLTVKKVVSLKKHLHTIAAGSLAHFLKLEELKSAATPDVTELKARQQLFKTQSQITFPGTLTPNYQESETQLKAISHGKATGQLITPEELQTAPKSNDYILYCQNLLPEYTQFFPHIKGILSENGGILSHLAIMAREAHLPVISGYQFLPTEAGSRIELNTQTPEVTKL